MTDIFLLRLRSLSADDPVEAVHHDPVRGAQALGRIPLADAAAHAAGKRVVVVLPATDVLALSLTLPDAASSKLRASLPFALEEQVACDIETQHCALGPRMADGRWPVRVIARARLEAWLTLLRAAGIEPQLMVSAADGLREKPGDLMLWLDGDDAHWRAPSEGPLTLPAGGTDSDDAHDSLVPSLVAALGERPRGTVGLVVHADDVDRARYAAPVAALQEQIAPLQWQTLDDGALAAFAPVYAQGVNLLQAEYAPKRAAGEGLHGRWRWPLRLAAAAVLLQSAGHAIETWRLHQATVKTDATLLETARPLQPDIVDPDAARSLLRSRLEAWSARSVESSTAPLLAELSQLAQAKAVSASLQVVALTSVEGGLRARLAADDADALTAATSTLAAAGWNETDDAGRAVATAADPSAIVATWRSGPRAR
jgi:general secretion pathway protein L